MRQVRFFEDDNGPKEENDGRRLLVGILDFEESPQVDGGRREAVRVATMADAAEFQTAYAAYYNSFQAAQDQGEQPMSEIGEEGAQPLRPVGADPLAEV